MIKKQTLGSETSQYQVEKKQICISLVAASEKEEAQTEVAILRGCKMTIFIQLKKSQKISY